MLFNIGDAEMTVGELTPRLLSRLERLHNVKKMVENGYLRSSARCTTDARSMSG